MFNATPKQLPKPGDIQHVQQPVKPVKSSKKPVPISQKVYSDMNEILRRLRILEERYSNLRKKNQLSDQNMLEDTKRLSQEIAVIQSTVNDLKKEVIEVNTKIKLLTEEMSQSVRKADLDLLSKYLDLWQPMNFIRKEEAKRIVEDIIEEIKSKPKVI
ncbi:MAG: hypothetical protein KKF44_01970 [Nanoarchaeota archaeon]|nr:hypothetical protein [Nanoarchaeota archaeon]